MSKKQRTGHSTSVITAPRESTLEELEAEFGAELEQILATERSQYGAAKKPSKVGPYKRRTNWRTKKEVAERARTKSLRFKQK